MVERAIPPRAGRETPRLATLRMGALGTLKLDSIRGTALRVGRLAEALFGVVEADVVAVQDDRVWRGKPRDAHADDSFSRWVALLSEDLMWVNDMHLDPAWRDHPAVAGPNGVRFFAAVPIRLRNGVRLGALRIIDGRPHPFDPELAARLEDLAAIVAAECDRQAGGEVQRIRELFDKAPGFMAIVSGPDLVFQLANEAYFAFVGHRDLVGRPAIEALPELAAQGFLAILSNVQRTGRPYVGKCVKIMLNRRPGAAPDEVYADFVFQPLSTSDGSVSSIFVQGNEVTAEKIAADLLKGSREELAAALTTTQAIFDNSRDVICTHDAEGVFTRMSLRAEELWGYRPDELVGRNFRDFLPPENLARSVEILRAVKSGNPTESVMGHQIHKDGSLIPVMWSLVWSEERQTMYCSARDMREHVASEAALRQAQKMEAVGRLTGGVAHDFNNLLTVVIGSAEALAEGLADQPLLLPVAQVALEAAEKGADLVRQLLAYSRTQPLAARPIECNRLLNALALIVRRTISEEIDVEVVCADEALRCLADETQLSSALLNLCINARDAMPGGGRLTIRVDHSTSAPAPDSGTEPMQGAYVVLSVQDTGSGMSPEVVAHALEPFFTTKAVGEGSGLGLSMVYGFATQSGGSLSIDSEVGVGTTMKIYLPETKEEEEAAPEPEPVPAPATRHHILLVEDDDLVRAQVERQLDALGYRVTACPNGQQALDVMAKVADIDLLLTDIVMPGGMNGRQLGDQARLLAPALRILFTSGYTEDVVIRSGRLDEASDFLAKPYRRADLARKLANAFERD